MPKRNKTIREIITEIINIAQNTEPYIELHHGDEHDRYIKLRAFLFNLSDYRQRLEESEK